MHRVVELIIDISVIMNKALYGTTEQNRALEIPTGRERTSPPKNRRGNSVAIPSRFQWDRAALNRALQNGTGFSRDRPVRTRQERRKQRGVSQTLFHLLRTVCSLHPSYSDHLCVASLTPSSKIMTKKQDAENDNICFRFMGR